MPLNRFSVANATLLYVPGLLAAAGLVYLPGYNPLPATGILEVAFFSAAFYFATRWAGGTAPLLFITLFALAFRFTIVALGTSTPLTDALQAHKWLIYIAALCVFAGASLDLARVGTLTKVLIAFASIKYSTVALISGLDQRTGLFTENNYEIPFFCGLAALTFKNLGSRRFLWIGALGVVTLLSTSRSGSLAFLILFIFILTSIEVRSIAIRYLSFLAAIAILAIPVVVFGARNTSLDTLDRIDFLEVFLTETSNWGLINWLFGTAPITPLSSDGCQALSYYQLLFSSADSSTCYSVILHAFLLRVIFDAGLVGLVFAFGSVAWILRAGKVEFKIGATLLLIAVVNSASVSGLNNVYVVVPIALALATNSRSREFGGLNTQRQSSRKMV